MKRTTIALDENLWRALRRRAAVQSTSARALANTRLRQALRAGLRMPYRLMLRGWRASLQPGVDLFDRHSLPFP
jgi:hypothetical protein